MRGVSHVASGILAWAVVLPALPEPVTPATALTGALITAGAALLPDADHPSGSIAHSYGPISRACCRGICAISGGHRGATHSLFFTVLATIAVFTGAQAFPWVAGLVVALMTGFVVRACGVYPPKTPSAMKPWLTLVVSVGAFFAAGFVDVPALIVATAFGLGIVVHLIGDSITPGGVPWLWPHPWRYSLPLLGASGSTGETHILAPLMFITGTGLLIWTIL